VGLWWANFFYDHGIKHWQSRKIGHFFGGVGFLLCALLFSSFIWPVILASVFTLMLGGARLVKPNAFRGVGGTGRATQALSEVWFPLISIPILGIGWGIFNRPIESVACLLMMSFGDCLTGWVRALKYQSPTKGLMGSVAMLITCSIIAWAFLSPLWLGILVALVATVVEFICGDVSPVKFLHWADDNFAIPACSALVYFGGLYAIGLL
jgi:dolichol kinase